MSRFSSPWKPLFARLIWSTCGVFIGDSSASDGEGACLPPSVYDFGFVSDASDCRTKNTAPEFISCEGPGFSKEWSKLKIGVKSLADSTPTGLADAILRGEHSDILNGIEAAAAELADKCREQAPQFLDGWQTFFFSIRDAGGKGGEFDSANVHPFLRPWVHVSEPENTSTFENAFCLLGCVTLFWYYGAGEINPGGFFQRMALTLLGIQTTWNNDLLWQWGDAFVPAMGEFGGWSRPFVDEIAVGARYETRHKSSPVKDDVFEGTPIYSIGAVGIARRFQPCDPINDQCWQSPVAESAIREIADHASKTFEVVVVGEHAMLGLDVYSSLQRADGRARLQRFVGAAYGCTGLADMVKGDPCSDDPAKEFMQFWIKSWQSEEITQKSVTEYADHLVQLVKVDNGAADLLICVDQAVFCWMLRRMATRPVQIPMLHIWCMSLLEYTPQPWRTQMVADVSAWLHSVSDRGKPRDVFCNCMEHMTPQVYWQTGAVIEFVPLLGSAVWSGVQHTPPHKPEVLVLRSAFWQLAAGRVLRVLLAHAATSGGFGIRWMQSFTLGSLSGYKLADSWLTWEEQAKNTVVLHFPPEFHQIKLRDLYALGVPIATPGINWALRSFRDMFRSWGQLHSQYRHQLAKCSPSSLSDHTAGSNRYSCLPVSVQTELSSWPYGDPFLNIDEDPAAKLAFWYTVADVSRFPYLLYFESVSQFILLVRRQHLEGSHRGFLMREHFRNLVRNVLRFYRRSTEQLMGAVA